jgi:hypothetical protein
VELEDLGRHRSVEAVEIEWIRVRRSVRMKVVCGVDLTVV